MNWYQKSILASIDKEAFFFRKVLLWAFPIGGLLGLSDATIKNIAKRNNYDPPAIKKEFKEIAKSEGVDPAIIDATTEQKFQQLRTQEPLIPFDATPQPNFPEKT